MSNKPEHLEDYPLFYEGLTRDRDRSVEQTKKESAYERSAGLSEIEVAKLGDDLRSPMSDPSSETDPMQ